MRAYQHFKSNPEHDVDGNPQRYYAVYELVEQGDDYQDYWKLVEIYDEGFGGRPTVLRGIPALPNVTISVHTYRIVLQQAEATGILKYGE